MGLKTLHDMITEGAQEAGAASASASSQQQKFLEDQWLQLQAMQNPFINQGQQAFGLYNQFSGGQGAAAQQQALSNFRMSPQAQFGLQQNLGNLNQNAAMTGGLFGGNRLRDEAGVRTSSYQTDLANYLEKLRAQAGLGQQASGSLGGVGTISGQGIAGAIMGQGDAQANAALAGAQAQQGVASGATSVAGGLLAAFSDERLKSKVERIGTHNDLGVYTWEWNDKANRLGLYGKSKGHIAQEVQLKHPDLVVQDPSGYLMVSYGEGRTMEAV